MTDYQPFLTVSVRHEYYNAHDDELAPVEVLPEGETALLLKQCGMLMKAKPGFIQLIADPALLADLADLINDVHLTFFLISHDSALRSITNMPAMFDITNINASFTQSATLSALADSWTNRESIPHDITHYDKNLLGVLNIHIPKGNFTTGQKSLTVQFHTLSTFWKYYFFSLNAKPGLSITCPADSLPGFTEQPPNQIAEKTARVFLSNNKIPLQKVYTASLSLLQDNRTMIKSLPVPRPDSLSTILIDGEDHLTSHIYVN